MKNLDLIAIRREFVPRVSAAFLARHGLLSGRVSSFKGFMSHGVQFVVRKTSTLSLDIITNGSLGPVVQNIYADYMVAGAFDKPFFLCPIIGKRCKEVLLINGFWASRAGHELRTRNGIPFDHDRRKLVRQRDELIDAYSRPWAHSQKKQDLLHEVRRYLAEGRLLPDAWKPLERLTEQAAEERRAVTRNSLRAKQPAALSLEAAIKGGGSAARSVELGIHLTVPRRNSVQELIRSVGAEHRAPAQQESHHCLDLATLRARRWLNPGKGYAWILDWPGLIPGADRAVLRIDLVKPPGSLYLDFMTPQAMRVASQTIALAERPGMPKRLFLVCPLRGTLHDRLYFRDGFFASAVAQRLKTASQL